MRRKTFDLVLLDSRNRTVAGRPFSMRSPKRTIRLFATKAGGSSKESATSLSRMAKSATAMASMFSRCHRHI